MRNVRRLWGESRECHCGVFLLPPFGDDLEAVELWEDWLDQGALCPWCNCPTETSVGTETRIGGFCDAT